jgi:hypothetical protein
MANSLYSLWKSAMMTGQGNCSLDQNTVVDGPHAALMDTATHGFVDTDQFLGQISAFIVGTAQRIVNPTVGVVGPAIFDGSDVTFTAVNGPSCEALVIARNNAGGVGTARLIAYIDGVTGLPVTPNGGDILVFWNISGIFRL